MPHVVAQSGAPDSAWLLEEMIEGRPFGTETDWQLAENHLVPALLRFYDGQGLRHVPLRSVYARDRIAPGVNEVIAAYGRAVPQLDAVRFRTEMERCFDLATDTVPVVIGHGDLARSNLLIDLENRIVIVDWERCRSLPLSAELLKLLCQRPQLWRGIAPGVQARTERPHVVSPATQFFLAALEKLAALAEWRMAAPGIQPHAVQRRHRAKATGWLAFAQRMISI